MKFFSTKGEKVKLQKTFGLLPALLLLALSGLNLSYAQDAATPVPTPSPARPQTMEDQAAPAAPKKLSVKEKLDSLEAENQKLEERLNALEIKAQASPTPTTATPVATSQGPAFGPMGETDANAAGVTGTRGVHDLSIPFVEGNEYMYSESRYLSFTNPGGDTEFRIGGYDWTDLDLNFQNATVNQGVTQYQYINGSTPNGFIARKAHLDFRGTFGKLVGAAIGIESDKSTEVSIGVYHAYAYVKFDKALVFQAGKMSNPLSLEGLQPSADLPFVEPSMVANLAVNKDIGAEFHGEVNHFFDYVLEIANGQQDNESSATGPGKPTGDMKSLTGRVFFTPWEKSGDEGLEGLGFGGGGAVDNETSEDTTIWAKLETSVGGNAFMTYNGVVPEGSFYHLDGQGYYYNGSLGFLGEWIQSIQTVAQGAKGVPVQLANTGWLTEVQWVIGGKAGFEGAEVDNPFDPSKGHWGALELVARTDTNFMDIQSFTVGFPYAPKVSLGTGAQVATAFGVGVNWWFDGNFKWMCDFETTNFSGGNETVLPENIVVARAALTL